MQKMKIWATGLLLAALAGAVISWPFRENFWGGLALAAFEASLVGALADWFAVVALFRHPMGLKFIPHTAIIPSNRDRIIDSIVYMVENQWLKLEVIKAKIQNYNVFDKICVVLQSDEGKERLKSLVASVLSNTIKDIEPEDIAQFILKAVKENFSEIKVSPELVYKLEVSLKELYSDDIIDFFADGAKGLLDNEDFLKVTRNTLRKAADDYTRRGFLRRLGKGLGERFDLINYGEAAESIAGKLREVLDGIKSRNNPYREKIREGLINLEIIDRSSISTFFESWIQKAIYTEDGQRVMVEMVRNIKKQLFTEQLENSVIVNYFTDMAVTQLNTVGSDEKKKVQFEDWVKCEVLNIVERYHGVIGKLVKENLRSLNDQAFVESLEDRVSEDLQWIRINGTVIGAIVGVAQYLILHLI